MSASETDFKHEKITLLKLLKLFDWNNMPENEESLKTYGTVGIEKLTKHLKIGLQSQECIVDS